MESVITLSQAIIFFCYLIAVNSRFGVLESISHSTYEWAGDKRYWFMAMCWSLAFLNLFQGMGMWGIATSVGLIMTGVAMDWQGEWYKRITHLIGAVLAILAGLIGLYFVHGFYLPFVVFCLSIYPIYKATDDYVWWIEVVAVALILIGYTMR